jgi:hypothetical protein
MKVTYFSIFRESFIVSVQNMSAALDNVDRDLVSQDLGERVEQVLIEQVKQFGRELNTSRATATNNKR